MKNILGDKKTIIIRRAFEKDAAVIADFGRRTFEAAFGPDNDPGDIQAYLKASFSLAQIAGELALKEVTFLLAHLNKTLVGYAKLQEGVPPDSVSHENAVQLSRLYVTSQHIGRGFGSQLIQACIDASFRQGYETVWLGVWEENLRAKRLYERFGFVRIGTKPFVLGTDVQQDARVCTISDKEKQTRGIIMTLKKLNFKGSGGNRLSALLDLPVDGDPEAFALFAHCFTCTKNLKSINHISRALTREGVAVLRFDFTGLGESEGDFAETNFSTNIADLVAAAGFLEVKYEAPKILIGHSLGGAAVLQAAGQIPSTKAVAIIGTPADPAHVMRHFREHQQTIALSGEAEVVIEGRHFRIKKQFLDDLGEIEMDKVVGNLKKALLIFHSPVDTIVGIDNAARIFQSARHPKSFISLDQADHLLMDAADAGYVGDIIAAWARKYLRHEQP